MAYDSYNPTRHAVARGNRRRCRHRHDFPWRPILRRRDQQEISHWPRSGQAQATGCRGCDNCEPALNASLGSARDWATQAIMGRAEPQIRAVPIHLVGSKGGVASRFCDRDRDDDLDMSIFSREVGCAADASMQRRECIVAYASLCRQAAQENAR
ncbi:hypothetical protein MRB53_040367 [Persea americana]|nr:hypothetical protein MRB53_040367 [Persea americana]